MQKNKPKTKQKTLQERYIENPMANLPAIIKAVNSEAKKIREQKKKENNMRKGYWLKDKDGYYKI